MFLRFSAGISNNHPNSTRKLEETLRRKKFFNYKTDCQAASWGEDGIQDFIRSDPLEIWHGFAISALHAFLTALTATLPPLTLRTTPLFHSCWLPRAQPEHPFEMVGGRRKALLHVLACMFANLLSRAQVVHVRGLRAVTSKFYGAMSPTACPTKQRQPGRGPRRCELAFAGHHGGGDRCPVHEGGRRGYGRGDA